MTKQDKVAKVMHEWKNGRLFSHGKKVTDYDQAIAIALSEAGLSKKYDEGGEFEDKEDFIEDVKEMHEAIDYVVLKNGTKVKGEELMERGGTIEERKQALINDWIKPFSWGKVDEDSGVVKAMANKYDLGRVTVAGLFNEHSKEKFSKGGNIIERRYVNKGQDYETRYAKNRPSRMGYKEERKFAVGGEIGNTVSFKGDYGTPRSGVVKEKRGSSYIVSTDDGDRLVDSYEVISFSETPVAKKKRFGFFAEGGSIEEYKQAEKDYDKYGEYLEDAIEDENEADIKKYTKLMNEAENRMHRYERKYAEGGEIDGVSFSRLKSSFKDNLEILNGEVVTIGNSKFKIEGNKLYRKTPTEDWHIWRIIKGEMFAEGGEIQSKIDKLQFVVNAKMIPENIKEKARKQIAELEKELHESKETKAEEKAEHEEYYSKKDYSTENWNKIKSFLSKKYSEKSVDEILGSKIMRFVEPKSYNSFLKYFEKYPEHFEEFETKAEEEAEHEEGGSEARLDKKEELNATIQKLYAIESKAEDLINYQSGGIQGQSVDKIKKYVEYINKEVSKLDVPFGSEVFEVLEDENAHSLNLTLGLLGFYKNEEDSGSWAKSQEAYTKLVDVVNEVKGGGKATATTTKEIVGYGLVDPISGDIVASKKTIAELMEASKKLEKTKGFEDMSDLVYEIVKKDDKNVIGNKVTSVDINLMNVAKKQLKKPTTRKAPVKKAVAKKVVAKNPSKEIVDYFKSHGKKETYLYNNRIGFNKGMQSKEQYNVNHEWISKQAEDKPKADHKKLVAKLKAKKGAKEYDNRASLNTETGERRKRNISSDKKREALPLGKRVSEDGNIYWENRLNRGDLDKGDKFEKGGEVKGSGWGLNLNW